MGLHDCKIILVKVRLQLYRALWAVRQDPRLRWSCTFALARTRSWHDAWSCALSIQSAMAFIMSQPLLHDFLQCFSHIHILLELCSYLVSCFQQYLTRAQHNNIPAPVNFRKNDGQIMGFYNWWSVPWQAGSVPEDNKRYWICPLLNYTFQVSLSMFEAQPAASSIVMKPITICKH